ncbi:MAG: tyrosine phenol-lyase [Bacteroidetes bacterium B1(2017)]|nr:MAG: tyrosine phenol-lyase [Cytophagaceae bacterium BCCC1]OYU82500.1 MAG: tyrosine phenol-lyase [Flavobacterium sp. BFFFF2]OYU93804.1 MAG: tyrosine phenol-lyase [Bacteroidetes bacterium B1(2017)]
MKTIIEPFRIKSIEPIYFTTETERKQMLADVGYNLFGLKAENVIIDLLTDSGTSAMSAMQWAGIMNGDESYAGSRSFYRFEETIKKITGLTHIIPTHQGRAAEKILFSIVGGEGQIIPNNTHFDTTRANIEFSGAEAIDFLNENGKKPDFIADFKGNMDVEKLRTFLNEKAEKVPLVMLTITNNSGGGQPVSMENIRQVSEVCREFQKPFFLDACRFAENAYFIKIREKGYENKSILEICQEMFSYADGMTMSAKKDALVNIGGFLALNDSELAQKCRNVLVVTEGFPTYGGLAGRDLEAIAQGLEEILDESYLHYRIRTIAYLGEKLVEAGVPLILPTGGHAVYLDAGKFCGHIPNYEFPGQAIACALYLKGGIRACEIGSIMFGKYDENGNTVSPDLELVRLAIPRRVYTQSHIDYVAEVIIEVFHEREKLKGFKIVKEPTMLRHFTAEFAEL